MPYRKVRNRRGKRHSPPCLWRWRSIDIRYRCPLHSMFQSRYHLRDWWDLHGRNWHSPDNHRNCSTRYLSIFRKGILCHLGYLKALRGLPVQEVLHREGPLHHIFSSIPDGWDMPYSVWQWSLERYGKSYEEAHLLPVSDSILQESGARRVHARTVWKWSWCHIRTDFLHD